MKTVFCSQSNAQGIFHVNQGGSLLLDSVTVETPAENDRLLVEHTLPSAEMPQSSNNSSVSLSISAKAAFIGENLLPPAARKDSLCNV